MFDTKSRYFPLATKTLSVTDPDGQIREIRYVERRFLPPLDSSTTLFEHVVAQGDRLDNVTAKYFGDPTQYWRVADANDTMRPEELTEIVQSRIKIPLPH
jgi:hypothetical protein